MARRNLIIVRAGDDSCHPQWLRGFGFRNFDLMVSYFGDQPGKYRAGADHYHAMPGPRWPGHHAILRDHAKLIARYDYVCFACDDLTANLPIWNRLFSRCRKYRLDLAQPSIKGHISFAITRPNKECVLRFTNFVEVMCPVFSKPALKKVAPSFSQSVSGWGLSIAWHSILGPQARIAILDRVSVLHGRPVRGGTLYPLLASLGVDPKSEKQSVSERYGAKDFEPKELSRLTRLRYIKRIWR